jgi:hypothetical protein
MSHCYPRTEKASSSIALQFLLMFQPVVKECYENSITSSTGLIIIFF